MLVVITAYDDTDTVPALTACGLWSEVVKKVTEERRDVEVTNFLTTNRFMAKLPDYSRYWRSIHSILSPLFVALYANWWGGPAVV